MKQVILIFLNLNPWVQVCFIFCVTKWEVLKTLLQLFDLQIELSFFFLKSHLCLKEKMTYKKASYSDLNIC